MRCLDIGAREYRLDGFETLDIDPNIKGLDYVLDASQPLPFEDNSFDIVHASHIIEHISYTKIEQVLKEWIRILRPGGVLEIWTPNLLRIAQRFLNTETGNPAEWKRDPCEAFCVFIYPPGHVAAYTERYLKQVLKKLGIKNIRRMTEEEDRHAKPPSYVWRNLGIRGIK